MLTETFIAASSAPPKDPSVNTSLLKDAGVFVHSFQPQPALRSTLKKSTSPVNCLAISETHIYTAQSGKALIHVYGREKGKQEAIVPFPERIQSIVLAADETVLVLGTENGGMFIWEISTGRQISTPQAHLQAVTALTVDRSCSFLLSGSLDSNVLVWSFSDLLAFPAASSTVQNEVVSPAHTLSAHRDAITSLVVGHASSSVNIAVSASKDGTAAVWNYHSGELLRTILLPSTPLCLAIDPADRAVYTGYEDGSVQCIDFYTAASTSLQDTTLAATPVQPPPSTRWIPPSQTTGSAISISLSYDGTTLITGHNSGKILCWDIAAGRFQSQLAEYGGSPITNLSFLPPTGFPNARVPRCKATGVTKPRPHEAFSTPGMGRLAGGYRSTTQFPSTLSLRSTKSTFEARLNHIGFPADYLIESLAELISESTQTTSSAAPIAPAPDFMSLEPIASSTSIPLPSSSSITDTEAAHAAQLAVLQTQISHLKKLQQASNAQIATLAAERTALKKNEERMQQRRMKKLQRRDERAKEEWDVLAVGGKGTQKDGGDVRMSEGSEEDGLSSTSESSAEEDESDEE